MLIPLGPLMQKVVGAFEGIFVAKAIDYDFRGIGVMVVQGKSEKQQKFENIIGCF